MTHQDISGLRFLSQYCSWFSGASQANSSTLLCFTIATWHLASLCSEDIAGNKSQYVPRARNTRWESEERYQDWFGGRVPHLAASKMSSDDPTFWDSHPFVIPLSLWSYYGSSDFFLINRMGASIRMLILRLVYENSHLSYSLSLAHLACYIRRSKVPYRKPMWQGTEANSPTSIEELNPANHPVSELGSGASPLLATRYRQRYQRW